MSYETPYSNDAMKDLTATHERTEKLGRIMVENKDSEVIAKEKLMLRELFSQIDRDGSGALSASELLAFGDQLGVSSVAVRQMMIEADDDGDGEIDFEEFCLLFRRGDPNAPWKQIKKLHRHRFSNDPLSYVRLSQTADASLQSGPGGWAPKIASYEEELMQIVSRKPTSTMYVNHGMEESNLERVKELITKGARPNSRSEDSMTSIMIASKNCHSKILSALVAHPSADLDLTEPTSGCTALHYAVRPIELEILLAYGADRWKRNNRQATPAEELAVRLVSALHQQNGAEDVVGGNAGKNNRRKSADTIMKEGEHMKKNRRTNDGLSEAEHLGKMLNGLSRTRIGGSELPEPRGGVAFPGAVCIHYKWAAPHDGIIAKLRLQMGWSEKDHRWNKTDGEQYVGVGVFDMDEGRQQAMLVACSRAEVNPHSTAIQHINLEARLKIQQGQYVGIFMPKHLNIDRIPVAFHDTGAFQHSYCYMKNVPDLYGSGKFFACEGHVGMQTWIEYADIVDLQMVASASTSNLTELVERGANINATYKAVLGGRTPLSVAAMSGDYELVRAFLEYDGIDPTIRDDDGMTALHLACRGASYVADSATGGGGGNDSRLSYQDIACALIQRTTPVELRNSLINAVTNDGLTALHEATTTVMAENRSTVHFVRTINLDVLLALLEGGADPSAVDNEGDSPLHLICRSSHSPRESQFGDGAGPDRWTEHEYVVRLALFALSSYYLNSSANRRGELQLFAKQNASGNTPLMEAVTCLCSDIHRDRHHRAAIHMLLEHSRSKLHRCKGQSVGLSCVNTYGENAFTIAASNQDLLTACLIASGGGFQVDEGMIQHVEQQHERGKNIMEATLLVSDADSARVSLHELCDMGIAPHVYIDSNTGKRLKPPTIEVEHHGESVVISMVHDERGARIMWTMDGTTPTSDQRSRHEYLRPFLWSFPGCYKLRASAFVLRGKKSEHSDVEVLSSTPVEVQFEIRTHCGFGCGERLHMHERSSHENKFCTRWSIIKKKLGLDGNDDDDEYDEGSGAKLSHLHPGRRPTPKKKSVEEIEEEERERMENTRERNEVPSSRGSLGRSPIVSANRRHRRQSTTVRETSSSPTLSLSSSRRSPAFSLSPKRRSRAMSSSPSNTLPRHNVHQTRNLSSPSPSPISKTPSLKVTAASCDEDDDDADSYDNDFDDDEMGVTLQSPIMQNSNRHNNAHNDTQSDPIVQEYMRDMIGTVSGEVDNYAETVLTQHRGLVEQMTESGSTQGILSPAVQHQLSPLRDNRFIQFLLELEVDPMDAVEYQQKLNKEGFASVASICCSKLKSHDLTKLGVKRGHANLIISELKRRMKQEKHVAASMAMAEKLPLPRRKNKKRSSKISFTPEKQLISPLASADSQTRSLSDPKTFDTMDTVSLCHWFDKISLGQYKPMVRRLHMSGARLLNLTEVDLRKLIPNRFHRQHLRNACQSQTQEHNSLSKLMHGSGQGHLSMCVCEACVFAANQRKPRRRMSNVQKNT